MLYHITMRQTDKRIDMLYQFNKIYRLIYNLSSKGVYYSKVVNVVETNENFYNKKNIILYKVFQIQKYANFRISIREFLKLQC